LDNVIREFLEKTSLNTIQKAGQLPQLFEHN